MLKWLWRVDAWLARFEYHAEERRIAQAISRSGGRLTDSLEREIGQRMASNAWLLVRIQSESRPRGATSDSRARKR
jgi:hypothetical protein